MICCCSLAGTRACELCSLRQPYYEPRWNTSEWPRQPRKVIEKFDKDGKLIERIIEE